MGYLFLSNTIRQIENDFYKSSKSNDALMQLAGFCVYSEVLKVAEKTSKILVLTGGGNNGCDGYVAASQLINNGYKTFLVGMAIGFDLKVFEILQTKKKFNIDVIACVPCKNQDKLWTFKQKEQYKTAIEQADKVVFISEEYFDGCMQKRNMYMVDNSSIVVAYMYAEIGGTKHCVNYAKKKNKNVIFI
jgi:predicted GTPase